MNKRSKNLWGEGFVRLRKNKVALFSFIFIGIICFLGFFSDWIAPYSFDEQDVDKILKRPHFQHWLGTDGLGRDLLSRIIYGAKFSMAIGIFTTLISMVIGFVYGTLSGWIGGRVDSLMMRFVDLIFCVPSLVLMILVKVIFDSLNFFPNHPDLRALFGMILALSTVSWVLLARVIRGQALQVKKMVYVEAAQALGIPFYHIIIKHIVPNILGPSIVLLSFQIPANILAESLLSFLGLGLQPPFSSWGVLASEGWKSLRFHPHLIISPSLFLFVTLLSFQLLGDGLRDAFDPKMKSV